MSKYSWEDFPPHVEAREKWAKIVEGLNAEELEDLGAFLTSSLYLDARLAYRRYINQSPSTETT